MPATAGCADATPGLPLRPDKGLCAPGGVDGRSRRTTNGRATGGRAASRLSVPFSPEKPALEAILARTGAVQRPGTVEAGNTVGDAGAESRAHRMSVELSVASTDFLGESTLFSIAPARSNLSTTCARRCPPVDAAIVVCESRRAQGPAAAARDARARGLATFRAFSSSIRSTRPTNAYAKHSRCCARFARALVTAPDPDLKNDIVEGFVDLALERAFVYPASTRRSRSCLWKRERRSQEGSALHDAREARRP